MNTATLAGDSFAVVIPFPFGEGSQKTVAAGALKQRGTGDRKTLRPETARPLPPITEVTPDTDIDPDKETRPEDVASSSSCDRSGRDQLILEHLPLVRAVAVRVFQNLPLHVELEDLVHAGILGLLDAANKYDDSRQVPFRAYAKHRIRGAILDSLRTLDWASRDLRRRHKQLDEAMQELSAALERQPTEAEIAEKMGMDLARWRQVAIELRVVGLISASSRTSDNEDNRAPDFPAAPDTNPDVMAGHQQLKSALAEAMSSLSDRHRLVIHSYYAGGQTMREISESMGVNESRVSQIHKAALERMAEKLHSTGIRSAECIV